MWQHLLWLLANRDHVQDCIHILSTSQPFVPYRFFFMTKKFLIMIFVVNTTCFPSFKCHQEISLFLFKKLLLLINIRSPDCILQFMVFLRLNGIIFTSLLNYALYHQNLEQLTSPNYLVLDKCSLTDYTTMVFYNFWVTIARLLVKFINPILTTKANMHQTTEGVSDKEFKIWKF